MTHLNSNIKFIYLLGIGGIGMSAIARHFHLFGYQVWGYDKNPSAITNALEDLGMNISFQDDPNALPEDIKMQVNNTLVIYTPAIPKDCLLLEYFQNNGYTILKRAAVLGEISHQFQTLAIAGTHGKTTTSSILAHILYQSDLSIVAFLGGISVNYQNNYLFQHNAQTLVAEADEFDRSFLTLKPQIAAITSVDADHLDIYGTHSEMLSSFNQFANKVVAGGVLFLNQKIAGKIYNPSVTNYTYSAESQADLQASQISYRDGFVNFEVKFLNRKIGNFKMRMPGVHNVENALVAIGIALQKKVTVNQIYDSLLSFKGIKRRFEFVVQNSKHTYIDDYAHHPTEIQATIEATKLLYPNKKLTIIFQPHLYSRTRDFLDEFAKSLSLCDELILLEIYPARELPIEGVNSAALLQKVSIEAKSLLQKEEVLSYIQSNKNTIEVLLTLGAGDIDNMVLPIKNILS